MPLVKGRKASQRVSGGPADAMKARQEKHNLSELQVNWFGKANLNASKSDLIYKYHVAHLSEVYRSRSKLDNDIPRSLVRPPPWANLDPRVLSPIPNTKKREAQWDDTFAYGPQLDFSATATGRDTSRSSQVAKTNARRRPASAGIRRGDADDEIRHRGSAASTRRSGGRPSSATVFGRETRDLEESGVVIGRAGRRSTTTYSDATEGQANADGNFACDVEGVVGDVYPDGDRGELSLEEKELVQGGYTLDEEQRKVVRSFIQILVGFDTCSMMSIIDDAFREAQSATGLQDFTGCGDE